MILPLLHATADGPFLTAWNFAPTVVIGLLLAAVGYGLALRRVKARGRALPTWQALSFYAGLLAIAVALLGPIDTFNDEAFFLHMIQHLALMQVAAPLILLGRPVQLALRALSPQRAGAITRTVLRPRPIRWALTALTAPVVAFLLFNGDLIVWHVPAFYNAALENDLLHEVEHVAFLSAALLYWWAIIEPVPRHHKMYSPWAIGSVFFSTVVGTALGAIITLADSVIYTFYLHGESPWGLTPETDQQIAGLIMWIGGGMLYFAILLSMLIRAFADESGDEASPDEAGTDLSRRASETA